MAVVKARANSSGSWVVIPSASGGSAVTSIYGRIGDVTAQTGDYTASQVGAAAASHTHTIANVTNLQTDLDSKTEKVVPTATGNIACLNASGELTDGGATVAALLPKSGGTLTGAVTAGGTQDIATAQVRNILASTSDLTAGTSELATGTLYLVYE